MASFSATVEVEDAWRLSTDPHEQFDSISPTIALKELYHPSPTYHDDEPARKRRRLPESDKVESAHPDGSYVSLAQVSMTLYSKESLKSVFIDDSRDPGMVPVTFLSLADFRLKHKKTSLPSSKCCFYLIGQSGSRSNTILLHHAKEFPGRIANVLTIASRLASAQKSKMSGLTWVETVLTVVDHGLNLFYKLDLRIFWKLGIAATDYPMNLTDEIFNALIPQESAGISAPWSPQDFYENVYMPPKNLVIPTSLQSDLLECKMYPFQKRALLWLLQREGVCINGAGQIVPELNGDGNLSKLFVKHQDTNGQICYASHFLGEIATAPRSSLSWYTQLRGGILAEEMGLGKTVELIALLLLHKRREAPHVFLDTYTNTRVTTSPATLIITPPTILQQWKNELETHAPSLRIFEYTGMKGFSHRRMDELETELLEYDIVLTTYGVIGKEIHFADEKPQRNFRREKKYAPRRSPLVQIQWWRVCLDEAQMVESGVSNAATVARLIPRCNAWAVTGTPLRKDVQDLLGLLIFLRYEPFCNRRLWKRMIASHRHVFNEIFRQIALRHTKSAIGEELRLPPQKRIVITVPFTAIEEQHYGQVFQQMCDDCGLNNMGGPLHDDWNPNSTSTIEAMRSWLTRLRQTCLHPEVGGRNRRALGYRDGPLRTVDEVLQVMIDQNETALRAEERAVIMSKVLQGHIILFGKETQRALDIFLAADTQVDQIVSESRTQFEQERQAAAKIKNDASTDEPGNDNVDEDDDMSEENKGRLGACKLRLRSALEVQHACYFFTANAYFELKSKSGHAESSEEYQTLEKLEAEYYEKAKMIRKEMLQDAATKAEHLMKSVKDRLNDKNTITISIIPPIAHSRGIESRKIIDSIEILRKLLNDEALQYQEWRKKMVDLITARLLDEDSGIETTGDEYETSTKQQDEQYVYLDALRCIIADRHYLLTGQINVLINHEMKEALKHAKEGEGHAPELLKEILERRRELIPKEDISLRGLLSEIRSSVTSVRWHEGDRSNRATAEAAILERELENLQKLSTAQMKAQNALEKELDVFRSTMNQRLEYYRQLQQISDTVAPLQEEADEQVDEAKVEAENAKEIVHASKLATLTTKRRFLFHLRTESSGGDEEKMCVICQSPFETGVLTVCGHQYCKDCIRQWWHEHRNCPICKRHLKITDFHTITYKPRNISAQEENHITTPEDEQSDNPNSLATPSKTSIYTSIHGATLDEIKSYDLSFSYGTKIDTLSRHMLWIREHDPGAKSIIFSQYRDFLSVLARAFRHFKIGCVEIGTKGSITAFQTDPSIECFLLHAKAESSGLNLVNATHVFLCEPLINAAIELQAIARVHRIGQRRQTTVWMYLVTDTVEEAIYDISVDRRIQHMRRTSHPSNSASTAPTRSGTATPSNRTPMHGQQLEEIALDAANSLALQQAPISRLLTKGQGGGELVDKDDLWHCLFHKARRADGVINAELEHAVGRHLRAEAAEERRTGVQQDR